MSRMTGIRKIIACESWGYRLCIIIRFVTVTRVITLTTKAAYRPWRVEVRCRKPTHVCCARTGGFQLLTAVARLHQRILCGI